jgi:hypothetical protein
MNLSGTVGEPREVAMNGDEKRVSEQHPGDERVAEAVRLDGNAAAGILSEVFVPDITTAGATCANCSAIRALGALLVYVHCMGTVLRCPGCDAVVLRVARTPTRLWLDPTGARLVVMTSARVCR